MLNSNAFQLNSNNKPIIAATKFYSVMSQCKISNSQFLWQIFIARIYEMIGNPIDGFI